MAKKEETEAVCKMMVVIKFTATVHVSDTCKEMWETKFGLVTVTTRPKLKECVAELKELYLKDITAQRPKDKKITVKTAVNVTVVDYLLHN